MENKDLCFNPDEPYLYYKGYIGSVQFDEDTIYGHLLFIDDSVSYEADNTSSIVNEFRSCVDDYIATCTKIGKEPNKVDFKILFNSKELQGQE